MKGSNGVAPLMMRLVMMMVVAMTQRQPGLVFLLENAVPLLAHQSQHCRA